MTAEATAALYRRFASVEARGSSDAYERLAMAVADDGEALTMLGLLDAPRRQPNLLFGALRWHEVDVEDPAAALSWLHAHPDALLEAMRTRRTQTNEVTRCAALLPALAQLPQPLALIEVGASAGLCLLYDAWRYHYTTPGEDHWVGPTSSPVVLSCTVNAEVPLPEDLPAIAWRAGLDLNPIDARDPDARRWLECLVWPEHHDRARTLRAALDVAAEKAPKVHAGDLITDLPMVLAQAPTDATVVVVHSATLGYVGQAKRDAFVALVARHGVHRLGAEGSEVLPRRLPAGTDAAGRFVVSIDEQALALCHPHGRTLTWLTH
jgi:hypothetical protein